MMIENRKITELDKGSPVTYVPPHADSPQHRDCERGNIKSWNGTFVFVEYGTGTAKATRPEDLRWG